LAGKWFRSGISTMTPSHFEQSLNLNTTDEAEKNWIRARVLAGLGSRQYHGGNRSKARQYYDEALGLDPRMLNVRVKRLLLSLGGPGDQIWKWLKKDTL